MRAKTLFRTLLTRVPLTKSKYCKNSSHANHCNFLAKQFAAEFSAHKSFSTTTLRIIESVAFTVRRAREGEREGGGGRGEK